jgi:hypothetical protein
MCFYIDFPVIFIKYFSNSLATNAPATSTTAGNSMAPGHHHFEVDLSYISSKVVGMNSKLNTQKYQQLTFLNY